MADDYLGRKMEEYRARQAAGPRPQRPAATLRRLLLRNRSYRGYDPHFLVRRDQLLRIIGVNTLLPSAMNRQVLRFRPVLADEAPGQRPARAAPAAARHRTQRLHRRLRHHPGGPLR